jgi:hypothetical protein
MAISPAQMAVVRRWFQYPTHERSQAVADAFEALFRTVQSLETALPNAGETRLTEDGELRITEDGALRLVD